MNQNSVTKAIGLLLCFFIACTVKEIPGKKELLNHQITFIFKAPPSNWKVYREAGGYSPARCEINLIDDHFIPIQFLPDSEREFDTLVVKTKRKVVEVRHAYKGFDELSYLFKNGDTVLFTYENKTPIATVLNRETKANDVNLDLFIKETFYLNDYSAFVKFMNPIFFMESLKNIQIDVEKEIEEVTTNFPLEIEKEKKLLDSLFINDLISNEIYQLLYTQFIYQEKIIELCKLNGGSLPRVGITPFLTKESFNIQLGNFIELGSIDGGNLLDRKNDSLRYFGYQNDLTDWVYFNYFSRKVGRINATYYINGIANAGGNIPDYLSLYDSIQTSLLLSKETKKSLKFKTIQNIIENYTIEEAKKAFKKFKLNIRDTAFISYLTLKYSLPTDLNKESYDLELTSFHSENITFDSLLNKHKGKVIYLDFWSSSCAPCIQQFKYSKELKEIYEDKDLVQIYISNEPNKETWKKACRKNNLINESYFISNRFISKQFENMNIQYIPQYMLFDKLGNLEIESAPRPDNKSLLKLIDKCLSEN